MASKVYTIAIVDDDYNTCEVLKKMIETASPEYQVFCAHDGRRGLALIRLKNPNVVVLDIDMPRLNGLAVLEEIKTSYRVAQVGVVMLTGNDTEENARASTYGYADAYLTKPCRRDTLIATIQRALSYGAGAACR